MAVALVFLFRWYLPLSGKGSKLPLVVINGESHGACARYS